AFPQCAGYRPAGLAPDSDWQGLAKEAYAPGQQRAVFPGAVRLRPGVLHPEAIAQGCNDFLVRRARPLSRYWHPAFRRSRARRIVAARHAKPPDPGSDLLDAFRTRPRLFPKLELLRPRLAQ